MDQTAITQLEIQVAIPLLVGLVAIGLAWIRKRLNLQADSTNAQLEAVANTAIQTAVTNFAGKVAHGFVNGELTKDKAVANLQSYLADSVGGSMSRLKPSADVLETMLLGKIAQIAGPELVEHVEDGRNRESPLPIPFISQRKEVGV